MINNDEYYYIRCLDNNGYLDNNEYIDTRRYGLISIDPSRNISISNISILSKGSQSVGDNAKFWLIPLDDGTNIIANKYSGEVLTISNDFLVMSPFAGSNNQKFWVRIIDADSQSVSIVSKASGTSLDCAPLNKHNFLMRGIIVPEIHAQSISKVNLFQTASRPSKVCRFILQPAESVRPPTISLMKNKANIDYPSSLLRSNFISIPPDDSEEVLIGETAIPYIFVRDEAYTPKQQLNMLKSPHYKLTRSQYWHKDYYKKYSGYHEETQEFSYRCKYGITQTDIDSLKKTLDIKVDSNIGFAYGPFSAGYSQKIYSSLGVSESHTNQFMQEKEDIIKYTIKLPSKECVIVGWRLFDKYRLFRSYYDQWDKEPIMEWVVKRPDIIYEDCYPHYTSI